MFSLTGLRRRCLSLIVPIVALLVVAAPAQAGGIWKGTVSGSMHGTDVETYPNTQIHYTVDSDWTVTFGEPTMWSGGPLADGQTVNTNRYWYVNHPPSGYTATGRVTYEQSQKTWTTTTCQIDSSAATDIPGTAEVDRNGFLADGPRNDQGWVIANDIVFGGLVDQQEPGTGGLTNCDGTPVINPADGRPIVYTTAQLNLLSRFGTLDNIWLTRTLNWSGTASCFRDLPNICETQTIDLHLECVPDPVDPDGDCVLNDGLDDRCPKTLGLTANGCPAGMTSDPPENPAPPEAIPPPTIIVNPAPSTTPPPTTGGDPTPSTTPPPTTGGNPPVSTGSAAPGGGGSAGTASTGGDSATASPSAISTSGSSLSTPALSGSTATPPNQTSTTAPIQIGKAKVRGHTVMLPVRCVAVRCAGAVKLLVRQKVIATAALRLRRERRVLKLRVKGRLPRRARVQAILPGFSPISVVERLAPAKRPR